MSKALKIAAVVVAVVAITVATAGIGTAPAIGAGTTVIAGTEVALIGAAATSASIFGLSVATLTTIAGGLSIASSVLAKPPKSGSSGGSPTDWKADPGTGVPYAMGMTYNAGNIVHRAAYGGDDNPYQSIVTVYSAAGPIDSISNIQFDNSIQAIAGGAVGGTLAGYAWVSTQLGAQPEGAALAGPFGDFPGWSAASKLSGKMAALTTFKYDKDGKKFPGGEPKQGIVAKWVKVYDPRLDSTYPGGSGAQRVNNEATWAWSANPWLHALTWALGRFENGIRTVGVGIAPSGIDIAAYVEAANVADANSWALGGVIYSTDDKWNAIKQMAAAGGGEPIRRGGLLSAFVNRPRTSLLTIGEDDLAGDVKSTAMQTRRNRLNGIVPIYRSEANDWQMVPGTVVRSATYLAEDGASRTREQPYDLVQGGTQAGQLAAYAIANSREIAPITVPCKPYMLQVRSGDAVTLNIPSAGLVNQLVVVLRREIDFANATVTLICRSETTAKHAYALGASTTAPPSPSLTATGNPVLQLPWAAVVGDKTPEDSADVTPVRINGPTTADIAFDYTGTAKAGEYDAAYFSFKAIRNDGVDVTAATTWARTLKTGTATSAIDAATGVLHISDISTDANIQISGTYASKTGYWNFTPKKVTDASPPATGGGGGSNPGTSDNTAGITGTTGSSYGSANTSVLTAKAGTAGQVVCSFPASFNRVTNGGNTDAYGKVQWRVVGGTFADIASEQMSSSPAYKNTADGEITPGSLTLSVTKSGLTAGTDYEFQLLLRGGGAAALTYSGTFTASGQ